MKQKHILSIFLVALSAVFSCERVDESQLEGGDSASEKVQMTFKAVIDGEEAETKTVLGGALGDDLRKVLWQPGDKIGVSAETVSNWGNEFSDVSEFTANITSRAESSEFKGGVELGQRYKAFYPYQAETLRDSANIFIFNLPAEQKYVNGSFDPNAAPMVASAGAGETFRFRNLCGVLALQVKGEGAVKSITFKPVTDPGNVAMVAGDYEVNPFFEDAPVISYHGKGSKSVTLSCDIPVELDPEQATPFYIVLPPAVYDSFTVLITLEDGRVMMKEGRNPLTVKRADVVAAGALTYVETLPIDLSSHGTANSYLVSEAGLYGFDASVIGNGEYGIIEGVGFHTDDPSISPAKVDVLWQDRTDVIDGLTYDEPHRRVIFHATGREGNALIAARDAEDNIIWSWHIWATDTPTEHLYKNTAGEFTVMDRNLGAIRADRGAGDPEQWRDAQGLMYQWGRKDPFAAYRPSDGTMNWTRLFNIEGRGQISIEQTIQIPTVYDHVGEADWLDGGNSSLWKSDNKTIYDPCPVGYVVSTKDVWKGFTITGENASGGAKFYNVSGPYDSGWSFKYDKDDESLTSYYPVTLKIDYYGNFNIWSEENYMWSAESSAESINDSRAHILKFYYYDEVSSGVSFINEYMHKSYANEVRCMKDENHVDMAYPVVTVSEVAGITTDAAVVYASVAADDVSSITERGVIWGTQSGLTLENGNVVPASSTRSAYSVSLSGLNSATKYYVRAYATNEKGTGYSKETSFYTKFSGDPVNLSEKGTSNSYIVRPIYGEYYFDASVKGNSEESVGQIASVEVLWETRNTANNIKAGSVVTSVELKGTDVHFQLPPEVKPGNALIAVKDALGTILWSWHIWVVDFDPAETQQTLFSGAIIMDRNLGATGIVPGSLDSFGFYYQWGRKDPFVIPGYMTTAPADAISYQYVDWSNNTIEFAVKNPTVVYNDASWNDEQLWNSSKTKYDPCPAGWRVPDKAAWTSLYRADNAQEGYFQLSPTSAAPTVYIPAAGRTDGDTNISNYRYEGHVWFAERGNSMYFWIWNSDGQNNWWGVDNLMSVRCMKDMSGQTGSGNDYVVDDEYVWE